MAIQINSWTPPDGFPERKVEYIERYYNLILEKAPKYEMFAFHELYTLFGFEWGSTEQKWLNIVSDDVRILLLNDYYIDWEHGSNIYVRLTEKGRLWRDKKETIKQQSTVISKPFEEIPSFHSNHFRNREPNQSTSLEIPKDIKRNKSQKITGLLNTWASVATIIGLLIVVAYLIPENTPWLGVDWWKNIFGF